MMEGAWVCTASNESHALERLSITFLPVRCGLAGAVHGKFQFSTKAFLPWLRILWGQSYINMLVGLHGSVKIRSGYVIHHDMSIGGGSREAYNEAEYFGGRGSREVREINMGVELFAH